MANVIKLRKGLDINLKGRPSEEKISIKDTGAYAIVPDDFVGVTPKVAVREGDHVQAGDALFVNKQYPMVKFASPVSGVVNAVVRGERRKVLSVNITADAEQSYHDFGKKDVNALHGDEVKEALLEAGLFGYINQLPYAVSTNPDTTPKAIFVSAFRDMPLSCDFEFELRGQEHFFQTGLTALSKMAKTYLGISRMQGAQVLTEAKDVDINVFEGPCPAGNVGVQVNHISPVNKGEVVWTVEPTAVIFFGRLFETGHVDMSRTIAFVGSEVEHPAYADMKVGAQLTNLIQQGVKSDRHVRIINGNVLTGKKTTADGFVGAHSSEITVIPEGDDKNEFLGWIMPRPKEFSVNRSYLSWLFGKKKEFVLDSRIKGSERHMIMSGEYDRVIPMDILSGYLVKAIIAGDIDRMEALGIYEVSPEDFALAEFVDSSKLELQRIVREGLNMLRKENS
jgi:Na+-transporting NADH:ubiquinone oxidoreductase subunit A